MKYRELGNSGIKVSEIGLGGEHLQGKPYEQVKETIDAAIDGGINIIDVFMSEPEVRENMGRALVGRRDRVILQGHIGSAWRDGQYARSRNLDESKQQFEDFMKKFRTDYVDIGMLHFVDTDEDYDALFAAGLPDYALRLKKEGVIKLVGVSSHSASVAIRLVESGVIDVLMFSINPAFDMLPAGTDIDSLFQEKTYSQKRRTEIDPTRAKLYRLCEKKGVAITVMKTLGAGTLLNAAASPFGKALTPVQCCHYALTRPGVSSVLIGAKTGDEMRAALEYEDASDADKDYSSIAHDGQFSMSGKCMYCNHCLPCPAGIDVAAVTKYLDMQRETDAPLPNTISAHYDALAVNAEACVECGSCEERCPFSVKVIENMRAAKELFAK